MLKDITIFSLMVVAAYTPLLACAIGSCLFSFYVGDHLGTIYAFFTLPFDFALIAASGFAGAMSTEWLSEKL